MDSIEDTPTYTCDICERVQFVKDMYDIDNTILSDFPLLSIDNETKHIGINEKICKQCKNAICNGDFPSFACPSRIRRNTILEYVTTLTQLEERLVAPRMAFAQIKQLGYKRAQIGLTGTIINVPANSIGIT